jgi:hypothetical protein
MEKCLAENYYKSDDGIGHAAKDGSLNKIIGSSGRPDDAAILEILVGVHFVFQGDPSQICKPL